MSSEEAQDVIAGNFGVLRPRANGAALAGLKAQASGDQPKIT
jgi:hypothetical protein